MTRTHRGRWALIGLLVSFVPSSFAWADWPPDGIELPGDGRTTILEDMAGGIYVASVDSVRAWVDRFDGDGGRVAGFPVLAGEVSDGVRIHPPRMAADGDGGVYLAWGAQGDSRSETSLARVHGSATVVWSRRLSNRPGRFWSPTGLAPGHSGDAYVAWVDSLGVRLTHVSAGGIVKEGWPPDGIVVAEAEGLIELSVDADGGGGVVVGVRREEGLLIQRFAADGDRRWTWHRPVFIFCWGAPRTIPDGAGGTFISWVTPDQRRLMAQRLDADGMPAYGWPDSGVVVTGPDFWAEGSPRAICGNDRGGIFLVWSDRIRDDVFAQHLEADGTPAPGWGPFGNVISSVNDHQDDAKLVPDGNGGVVIAWQDWRYRSQGGAVSPFAQRLTGAGQVAPGWSGDGTRLAASDWVDDIEAVTDGTGGAFVSWGTFLSWEPRRVQRVRGDGRHGPLLDVAPGVRVRTRAPFPQPFTSAIECDVLVERAGFGTVEVLDVSGRRVARLMRPQLLPAGSHRFRWDGRIDGAPAQPGIYLLQVRAGDAIGSTRLIKTR